MMDKQPLNTGEQKDMTEFFTDLISKLEEMSPDMVRVDLHQRKALDMNEPGKMWYLCEM